MIRECEKCGTVYDDVARWTLCPHGPLGGGNRYCREHDLDPCPFCDPTVTNPLVMPSPPPPPGPPGPEDPPRPPLDRVFE